MKTLNQLYKEPCSCTLCPACYGTSQMDCVEMGEASLEACTSCFETGFLSICSRCKEINRLLAEQESLAMAA
jgi:hypothetical protein